MATTTAAQQRALAKAEYDAFLAACPSRKLLDRLSDKWVTLVLAGLGSDGSHQLRGSVHLLPPARCLAGGRPSAGRRCGKLGQVAQRVDEMLRAERRELDASVPDVLRYR